MILLFLILIPLLAVGAIFCGAPARKVSIFAGGINVLLGGYVCFALDLGGEGFQWASDPLIVFSKPLIHLAFGVDGLSAVMVLLSVLVTFSAVFSGKAPESSVRLWYSSVLLISAGAIGAFVSLDLFFFYAFHELALIPTFIMIGVFGRGDRQKVAWTVTIYLALGSMILLAGLLWLYHASGTGSMLFSDLLESDIPLDAQKGIAACVLIGFGILVSLFPFHSWAAPAYASAPVPVSMLHAGVLKKFGLYGLLRLYPMISEGLQCWLLPLIILLLGNILWVGLITINQKRLDSMLGYSSVMHMGYVYLAIAALIAAGGHEANKLAIPGAVVLMFAHGVSIALLFALMGIIKDRAGSLQFQSLGGLAKRTPQLAFFFGLAAMASIGLPGLANFSGEVLVFFSGFYNWNPSEGLGILQVATIFALWGVVLSSVYMLRAFRCIFQGPLKAGVKQIEDLTLGERIPIGILSLALLVVGVYPNLLLQFFK